MFQYACWKSKPGIAHGYSSGCGNEWFWLWSSSLSVFLDDWNWNSANICGILDWSDRRKTLIASVKKYIYIYNSLLSWSNHAHQNVPLFYIPDNKNSVLILCQKADDCLDTLSHVLVFSMDGEQVLASNMYIWWLVPPSGGKQLINLIVNGGKL